MVSKYLSLEDYLKSNPLSQDIVISSPGGDRYPVKGREIDGTVLFADISSFSRKTSDMNPVEILAFVNRFFSWIAFTSLENFHGIVDKYIGDEVMVIFSNEFGSKDHFIEAVRAARMIGTADYFNFQPHIGIASGKLIVGYVGYKGAYHCSVFGHAVNQAARCAKISPQIIGSASMFFPAELWREGYDFESIFDRTKLRNIQGKEFQQEQTWELVPSRKVKMKNMPDIEVIEITNNKLFISNFSIEDQIKKYFRGES